MMMVMMMMTMTMTMMMMMTMAMTKAKTMTMTMMMMMMMMMMKVNSCSNDLYVLTAHLHKPETPAVLVAIRCAARSQRRAASCVP